MSLQQHHLQTIILQARDSFYQTVARDILVKKLAGISLVEIVRVIPKKNILDYVELYKQSLPEKFPTCLSRISPVIVCFDEYLVGNIMVMVCM